jgi:hypothetical protein
MTFTTKQYDTKTALKATLQDANGNAVDLTGATVYFRMGNVINRQALVQENGDVWFVFETDEVANPGYYRAEFHVEHADGRKEIFPNSGYIKVIIEPNIGGA